MLLAVVICGVPCAILAILRQLSQVTLLGRTPTPSTGLLGFGDDLDQTLFGAGGLPCALGFLQTVRGGGRGLASIFSHFMGVHAPHLLRWDFLGR